MVLKMRMRAVAGVVPVTRMRKGVPWTRESAWIGVEAVEAVEAVEVGRMRGEAEGWRGDCERWWGSGLEVVVGVVVGVVVRVVVRVGIREGGRERRCGGWDLGRVEGENLRMGKRRKLVDRVVVCGGSWV